ncbi:MAG: helix-turn-helix domain-containing protein [Rhizorhabdus sp.]|uniref:hypothetical protein n=1 Tax=Rhizorhabdus sp. TaxID=1968843 RepID=UPI001B659D98|nr:hypothetical protein [Rhizorhabdus sp.]MBP8233123.1 helix-turn-helix domain-containing protein [Rhizorhabdus sp.]
MIDTSALHQALKAALAKAGNNQSRFAADIGTSQQRISYCLNNGRPLPAELVLRAEAAGYGSRHELRPDLYPLPEADARIAVCSTCDARPGSAQALACDVVGCPLRNREAKAA